MIPSSAPTVSTGKVDVAEKERSLDIVHAQAKKLQPKLKQVPEENVKEERVWVSECERVCMLGVWVWVPMDVGLWWLGVSVSRLTCCFQFENKSFYPRLMEVLQEYDAADSKYEEDKAKVEAAFEAGKKKRKDSFLLPRIPSFISENKDSNNNNSSNSQ